MTFGPSPSHPDIDAPGPLRSEPQAGSAFERSATGAFEQHAAGAPLSRAALAAVVAAAVLMLGAVTIGAVLLNHDTQATLGDRVKAPGFSFAPPAGWEDNAGAAQERAALGGDVVRTYQSAGEPGARSVIAITAGPPAVALPDGDQAPGGALEQALVSATRAAGATEVGQPRPFVLDGQPALAIDFGAASGQGRTTGLRVAAVRDGTVYSASLLAPAVRYERDAATFRNLLEGWNWR
jgi:hypothetical protein